MSAALRELRQALGEQRIGPLPSFSLLHAVKALAVLAEAGPIGRGALAKRLGLGEGAIRTLLSRLGGCGLIRASRKGCELAGKGRELWRAIRSKLANETPIGKTTASPCEHCFAILVRQAAEKVKLGVEQRDEAIKAGARGALTLVVKGGKLRMPGVSEDVSADFPDLFEAVMRSLAPSEGDAVVVAYADDPLAAEYGALAAALSLL